MKLSFDFRITNSHLPLMPQDSYCRYMIIIMRVFTPSGAASKKLMRFDVPKICVFFRAPNPADLEPFWSEFWFSCWHRKPDLKVGGNSYDVISQLGPVSWVDRETCIAETKDGGDACDYNFIQGSWKKADRLSMIVEIFDSGTLWTGNQ